MPNGTGALLHTADLGRPLSAPVGDDVLAEAADHLLRCVEAWRAPGIEVSEFERYSRQITFARGEGLPGRAWDTGKPAWVSEAPFPRSVAAQRNGPCAALAFPLLSDGHILGVLEFFSPDLRQPDENLFPMVTGLGSQIAQFIEAAALESAVTPQRDDAKIFLREFVRELSREISWTTKLIVLVLAIGFISGILYLGFAVNKELRASRQQSEQQGAIIRRLEEQLGQTNDQLGQLDKSTKTAIDIVSLAPRLRTEPLRS